VSHAPIPTQPVFNPEDPEALVPVRQSGEGPTWFQQWKKVKRLLYCLYGVALALALLDLTYSKHSHFGIENVFGFYGLYGFIGCVTLVLLAKLLRLVVMRPEGYWDE